MLDSMLTRRRHIIFILMLMLSEGCWPDTSGPASLTSFNYPIGIGLSKPEGRYLIVANTNFDLRYHGATVVPIDLEVVRSYYKRCRDQENIVCTKFIMGKNYNSETYNKDEEKIPYHNTELLDTPFLLRDHAVEIGSYASGLEIMSTPQDKAYLYQTINIGDQLSTRKVPHSLALVPVRTNNTLTTIDVFEVAPNPDTGKYDFRILRCNSEPEAHKELNKPDKPQKCDKAHQVTIPLEPFGIETWHTEINEYYDVNNQPTLEKRQFNFAVVGHMSKGEVSLFEFAEYEDNHKIANLTTVGTICCPNDTDLCHRTCTILQSDPRNCGSCENICQPTETCLNGKCVGCDCDADQFCVDGNCLDECQSSSTDCSGDCVDLLTNRKHCGDCQNACPFNQLCIDGACNCPEDLKQCLGECVDLDSDTNNCGSCGNKCLDGQQCHEGTCRCGPLCFPDQICDNGQCSCPPGLILCGENCIDTDTDLNNCGICGNVCSTDMACFDGECRDGASVLEECGGKLVNVTNDRRNCGACGFSCGDGAICTNSICSCPESFKPHPIEAHTGNTFPYFELIEVEESLPAGTTGLAVDGFGRFIASSRAVSQLTTFGINIEYGPTFGRAIGRNLAQEGSISIDLLKSGKHQQGIAISPLSDRAFIASQAPDSVIVLDISKQSHLDRKDVLIDAIEVAGEPSIIRIYEHPDFLAGYLVYVVCFQNDKIYVIDPAFNEVVDIIITRRGPHDLIFDSKENVAYVVNFLESTISVIEVNPRARSGYHDIITTLAGPVEKADE